MTLECKMKTLLTKSLDYLQPRAAMLNDLASSGLLSISGDTVEIQKLFAKHGIDPSVYGNEEAVNNTEALVSLIASMSAEIASMKATDVTVQEPDDADIEDQDIMESLDQDAVKADIKTSIQKKLVDKNISDLTQMYGYPAQWAKFSPSYAAILRSELVDWCTQRNIEPLKLWSQRNS